jgi:aerobic-type carbon monoxide dehydrogenase small subunit (CoxS/CutS family)
MQFPGHNENGLSLRLIGQHFESDLSETATMHSCAAVQIIVNGISRIVNMLVGGQVAVKSCLILTVLHVGDLLDTPEGFRPCTPKAF